MTDSEISEIQTLDSVIFSFEYTMFLMVEQVLNSFIHHE